MSHDSNRKDKITTDHTSSEQERVRHEQDYIKHKGKEVASVATKAKEGHVSMPTTDSITTALQHGQESLDKLQTSDRGHQMGSGGDKIVGDIKRVLADQQTLIGEKNEGDILQNLVRDFWALLQELQQNSDLKVYFEEWQGTVTSVFTSGDLSQFFQLTGDLFTSMRDTDEFMGLASELVDLMKIVVSEATEKLVEGDTATKEEYKRQREMERRRVARELRYTLSSMTRNEMWRTMVRRSKAKVNQTQHAREASKEQAEQLLFNIRESPNFQRLLNDFMILLQRLVGEQMSVDPLFKYSKAALDDVAEDEELSAVVEEMQRILPAIAEDSTRLDDPNVQRELDNLARRADEAIMRLKNNSNIKGAKEESLKVATAIKEEAANQPILGDLKTLWRDLTSGKDGEVIDPDVLRSLRQMIVPLLVEHLNNVPLPSVSDEASFLGKYFYTIDEMKISLPELIPENIHLRFEYEMDANPLELEAKNQHTFLYLQASHLQLHLHDCHFTYERRTIPKHSDSGIFDVDTVGEGLTAWLKMEIKSDTAKGQYLDVLKSDVKISKFNITFRDSKHDHLYEMITHMFARKIKTAVIDMIQSKFKTFGSYFNTQILTLLDQAKASSSSISRIAKEKTEQARQGMENMKIHAKETKDRSEVQETKEEAKSTAKLAIERASEKVQDRLDDAKVQIEQSKREKELDHAIETTPIVESSSVTAPSSSSSTSISLETPMPQIPAGAFDPRAPYHAEQPLSSSSSSHYLGSPTHSHDSPFNAAAHALPSESSQFSPHFGGLNLRKEELPTAPISRPSPISSSASKDHNDESAWVSAKPEVEEPPKKVDIPAL